MLAQAKAPEVVVIDSVAASGADVSVSNGYVTIGTGRKWKRKDVADNSIALDYFLVETLESQRVTVAAAVAGTEYRFLVLQQVGGEVRETLVSYTPAVTTLSTFSTGLTAAIQAKIDGGQIKGTVVTYNDGTNYGAALTALTGYATFSITQVDPTSITVASALTSGTSTGNLSASSTTLTMLQSDTSAFAVGQTVKLSGWTGSAVIDGRTASQGVYLRVYSISANTNVVFRCSTITGSISAAATDYAITAQSRRGYAADLLSLGFSTVTAGNVYHIVRVDGLDSSNGNSSYVSNPAPFTKLYFINSGDGDALDLMTRINQVKGWLGSGGSFDPALMS